ncbi:MAG: hypothetical protein ABI570_03810 [Ilumatobacteraceae bacterium]
MGIPKFTPTDPTDEPRSYASPDFVPEPWKLDRKAEIVGRQPKGNGFGNPGPDQGYVLTLAALVRDRIRVEPGESIDDAIAGSITIALRRASQFGRAPVMADVMIALTIWGWLLDNPPHDLANHRRKLFAGLANTAHHYAESRVIADMVPETTFRIPLEKLSTSMPMSWRALTGAIKSI